MCWCLAIKVFALAGFVGTSGHGDGHVRCHAGSHGIAHPAAQGQQENHEGEYQMAHGLMIVGVDKSSIEFVIATCINYDFDSIRPT